MVAFDSAELAVAGRFAPSKKGDATVPAENAPVVKIRRSAFLKETGTGVGVNERRGREPGIKSEWVDIDEHIASQYSQFLRNHTEGLLMLDREHQGILRAPDHAHDLAILNYLTTEKVNSDGTTERVIDDAKLGSFLQRPEGWILTTQALEEQTALELFGIGLHAAADPEGDRSIDPENVSVPLGIDQGRLNRLSRRITEFLDQPLDMVGGRHAGGWRSNFTRWHLTRVVGVGAATGALFGGPTGAVVGGAIPATAIEIANELRSGVRLDMRQCSAAFQSIRNNPNEAAYLKHVVGIDVNDYVDAGNNTIEVNENRNPESTVGTDVIRQRAAGNIITRLEFYKKIGVPLEKLDALPEQFLYLFGDGLQEQTATHWQSKIQEAFAPNQGGIRDGHGNFAETAPGVANPQYNPDVNGVDFTGNLERYRTARRAVMMEEVMRLVQQERSAKSSIEPDMATIRAKINERTDGALKTKRSKDFEDRKGRLEADRAVVSSEDVVFKSYRQLLDGLQDTRDNITNKYPGLTSVSDIDVQIQRRWNELIDPSIAGSYAEQAQALLSTQDTELQNEINSIPATITGKNRDNEIGIRQTRIRSRYEARMQELDARLKSRLEGERVDLTTMRQSLIGSQRALEDNQDQPRAVAEKLAEWNRDFTDIVGWSIPGTADLTENDLRTQSVDEILRRINAVNTASNANGWPESRNDRREYRDRVTRAVLEARARSIESVDPVRPTRLPDYAAITSWNISENQLRHMTNADIFSLINAENSINPGNGWDTAGNTDPANISRVENARREAQNRIQVRIDAVAQQTRTSDEQIADIEYGMQGVNFDAEAKRLEAAQDLLGSLGEIISNKREIIIRKRERFTDARQIEAADVTYSQAEKTAGQPRGYYEFIDYLFKYKNRPDRQEYFSKIAASVTPEKLAAIFEREFNLVPVPVGPPGPQLTINEVLTRMDAQIIAGQITDRDLNRGLFAIIDRERQEALAI